MRVDGVDWNLEMGSVAEMIYHAKPDNPPAILFENIPGLLVRLPGAVGRDELDEPAGDDARLSQAEEAPSTWSRATGTG